MNSISFELGRLEHAKEIERMRRESGIDLTEKLGQGPWSGSTKLQSIRERLKCADPTNLRRTTIYVACRCNEILGSVCVSMFPPGFWRKSYWREPDAKGLGVFGLVTFPLLQRQGIGRFLMHGVEELARTHSIPYVRLDAYSENPFSNGFYLAIGYDQREIIDLRGVGLVLFEKYVLPHPPTVHIE